jgi:uncharacterized lipoprotein YajG
MKHGWLLALILLLAGCASQPQVTLTPPLAQPRSLAATLPASMLSCRAEPDGSQVATVRQTARYVVDLRVAGADCRRKLNSVSALVAGENKPK